MLKACADRALACLCTLVAVVVVMASSLPINAAQAVAGALGRMRWSRALASHWWSLLQFMAEVWSDVRISFTGDSIAGSNECAICISNHSPGIDMLPGICLAGRAVGAGSVIATIKQSLRYVPGIGWTNYLQGSLFLKRSWTQDRPALGRRLDSVPRPFWLGVRPSTVSPRLSTVFANRRMCVFVCKDLPGRDADHAGEARRIAGVRRGTRPAQAGERARPAHQGLHLHRPTAARVPRRRLRHHGRLRRIALLPVGRPAQGPVSNGESDEPVRPATDCTHHD